MLGRLMQQRSNRFRWVVYPVAIIATTLCGYFGWCHEPEPDVGMLLSSAEFLARVGVFDEAEEAVDRALEREPDHPHGLLVKGYLAEATNRLDLALESYGRALHFIDDDALSVDIRLSVIDLYRRKESYSEVETRLDWFETEFGVTPRSLRLRGVAALDQKHYEDARRHFESALAKAGDDLECHALIAQAHIGTGRLADARDQLEQAGADTSAWSVWQRLARAHMESGEKGAAHSALARYVELDRSARRWISQDVFWQQHRDDAELMELIQ